MADATPQLKRKRESAIGAQKKAKKQRKSEAIAGQDAGAVEEIVAATPVAVAEPIAETQATRTPIDRSKPRSRKPQTNGVPADAPATATSNSKPDTQSNGVSSKVDAPDASINTPLKQSKKQRRQEHKDKQEADQPNGVDEPAEEAEAQSNPAQAKLQVQADKLAKKKSKKERKAERKALVKLETGDSGKQQASSLTKSKKQNHKTTATWTASLAQGGWFLPADPIFSLDEKYLILANPKSVQIYFTETSLLARTLPINHGFVTAFALSSTKPNQLYVADSSELITLWDWVDGTKLGRWKIGATVRALKVITQPGSDEDLVYCHESRKHHVVNVHALRTKAQAGQTELKQVLKTSGKITSLQVLLQGKYVVVSTTDTITVGKRLKASKTAVQDFSYVWREIKVSKRITTCSTYFRQPDALDKPKKTAQDQRDVLDLAVGDETGVVLLFEDILASFATIESGHKGKIGADSAESFRPKRLHWHREAVGSVKWSKDGNYLISGGDETVLTIWQLSTGKPSHLPHLTAAIENVVVSPSGSSYALTLANNSVIVLSTTELDAKTNIVGIQTRRVDTAQLAKSKTGALSTYALQSVPIAIDPKNAQHVLFAVPSSQPRQKITAVSCPSPYLQTFDTANQRPVSRQALTRNNATDPNMGPGMQRVLEPNVHLLQISHDGEWLATVDEWLPPRADLKYLNEGESDWHEEERLRRREVYLKIWRRDEKNGQWTLETRLDAPHFLEDISSNGRVLDLVANPKEYGFATIGEDHLVRIWTPKTRLRDGLVVRGAGDKGKNPAIAVNWSLQRSIELPNPSKLWLAEANAGPQHARTSRLAFSADGSVLAAGVSGSSDLDHGLVHLIDVHSATVRRSMTEIDATVLCGLGIVGRYLVVVTDCITVWDMVYDDMVYCAATNTAGADRVERTSIVRLAVNEADGTFAVSLPQFEQYEDSGIQKASSKISVYSTEQKEPLWSQTVPGVTLGLAARKGKGERGYIALDSVSCIRTISPTTGAFKLPAPQPIEQTEVQRIEDVVEDVREDATSRALQLEDIVLENEYDRPVVTQQDLEEIFHNENAPQAPKDVFSAVLSLFGGVGKVAA